MLQDECLLSGASIQNFSTSSTNLSNDSAAVKKELKQTKSNQKGKRSLPRSLSTPAKQNHLANKGPKSAIEFVDDLSRQKAQCNIKTETVALAASEKPFNKFKDSAAIENSSLMHPR